MVISLLGDNSPLRLRSGPPTFTSSSQSAGAALATNGPAGGCLVCGPPGGLGGRLVAGVLADHRQNGLGVGVVQSRYSLEDLFRFILDGVPGMPILAMAFDPVPEPKAVKNRVHWDVTVPAVASLVEAGATVLREPGGDIDWHVLADPEGNEFCAFTP